MIGKVNPSGKLATTFPVNYQDVPSAKTFPGKELEAPKPAAQGAAISFGRSVPAEVNYEDGIYVGYRYYETFKVKPVKGRLAPRAVETAVQIFFPFRWTSKAIIA